MQTNDSILAWVESIGGGYVWEREVFAVTVLEATISPLDVVRLSRLSGVEQIAINAEYLAPRDIEPLLYMTGLQSLVLANAPFSSGDLPRRSTSAATVEFI